MHRVRHVRHWAFVSFLVAPAAVAANPTLEIARECQEFVPLFDSLPANECFVTAMVRRESDDLVVGATCGKKAICLFRFDVTKHKVEVLDVIEALWWDEPRLALGPNGDVFLGARRVHDKQFVFERLRERAQTPGAAYHRRDIVPPAREVHAQAPGMPIRHYSPAGRFVAEIPLPESLRQDGVGALAVSTDGGTLCGLSAPGGRLFALSLETRQGKDYGEVVRFPAHHHTRPISRALMPGNDGKIYFCGTTEKAEGEAGDEDVSGCIVAWDPHAEELKTLNVRLPAVVGRHRFAAIDAVVKLEDGTFLGGTTDGYLFHFNPMVETIACLGKPLRQHGIRGLARGVDGLIYGVGGERGGLPRLFAFDPGLRQLYLGLPPTGTPPGAGASTFGDIGALVTTADGTLICGECERRGYLLVYRPEAGRLPWVKTFRQREFAQCLRDRFVDLAPEDGALRLAPTFLISDALARSSKIRESLSTGVYAKKIVTLPSACRQAELVFFGGGGTEESPMCIWVNGHEIRHVQHQNRMLTGGWDRETVPGVHLRPGANEFVFGEAGVLLVDADGSGETSRKGPGRVGPWQSGGLGPDSNLAGEYVVRVRVHGHPPRGIVTSPVIDVAEMAAGEGSATVPPVVTVRGLRLRADASTPPETSVRLAYRSGSTPDGRGDGWSDWRPADASTAKIESHRFVQWRATLASANADVTPLLQEVTLEAAGDIAGSNRERIKVVKSPDNEMALSSYEFDYADPHHPRMRHLRETYQLEAVVAPGGTEMEKFALLAQWTRRQWEGWNKNRYDYCPQWDALEILELAPKNLALGMCTHYAAVFTQCAAALGYHARELIVDHHCLTEIWSDQYGKWILQDPGLLPGHPVAFHYEHSGVPINALEMHQRSLAGSADDVTVVPNPPVPLDGMRQQMVSLYCRFAIPLRNDHLVRPEPQELEHGNDQYHWDGYLWWTDSLDPKYPEYSLQTNRPDDLYWTLNKTRITWQDTAKAGLVSVRLSGPIPNLDRFVVRTDAGAWQQTAASFEWQLHPGTNTLEVKAVNTMGIEGAVNRAVIEYTGSTGN